MAARSGTISLKQATIAAVFAYSASMRDEKLPRKALPTPQVRGGRGSAAQ